MCGCAKSSGYKNQIDLTVELNKVEEDLPAHKGLLHLELADKLGHIHCRMGIISGQKETYLSKTALCS